LLAVLIFSPLAYGTVEIWSYALMEITIAAAALLLFFPRRSQSFYRPPGLVPLLLIAGYLLLQAAPLPGAVVRLLSPEAYRIYHETAGVFEGTGWMPLSVHPRATLFEFARFLSYLVFYLVAVQLFTSHTLLKRTMTVIAVFAGILSLLVIIQFVGRQFDFGSAQEKIFWLRTSVHAEMAIGPYVNRNHYAGLMEMIFPLAVSLFLAYRPRSRATAWKSRLRDFLVHPRINHHSLYGITALLIGTSVFVSLSRGGIMSLTLSMAVLALWLSRKEKHRKAGRLAIVLFVGILILTGSNGWDRIFERFGEIRNQAGELNTGRTHYWRDGGTIIGHFPLTGSGTGTWVDIYPRFRTFPGGSRLEHAHNDYIEFLATGGIILVGLMGLALFRIARASYRNFGRRHERQAVYLFVASLTAVLSILLHSVVDFNLQVGANGLYLFFILAVMVSAAHTRFFKGPEPTYLPEMAVKPWLLRSAALMFFAGMLIVHGGALLANYHYSDYQGSTLTSDLSAQETLLWRQAAENAAFFDPLKAAYHHVAAQTAALLDDPAASGRYYRRTIRLYPLKARVLQDAGRFFARQGDMKTAEPLLRAGIEFSRGEIDAFLNYAAALFEHGRTTEGLGVLTAAMTANPVDTDLCLALMAWHGLSDRQMQEALPERAGAYRAFGDFQASLGRYEAAAAAYTEALAFVAREEAVDKALLLHIYEFFHRRHQPEKATAVLQQALAYFPDDARLQRLLTAIRNQTPER
jgi:O-antigen ligase/Tfp pilus assembly protein PilF